MPCRSVHPTPDERTGALAGDRLIPEPLDSLTHAITIHRPARDVWPWLAQMGAGSRAGWYSYDRLDNGGRASATRIVPELQRVAVGDLFPAAPGRVDGFHVLEVEPNRHLVLGWRLRPEREPLMTWAFVLGELDDHATRLVVRARASRAYPFYGMPRWIGRRLIPLVHFVMERRQLVGLADRAESMPLAAASGRAA